MACCGQASLEPKKIIPPKEVTEKTTSETSTPPPKNNPFVISQETKRQLILNAQKAYIEKNKK